MADSRTSRWVWPVPKNESTNTWLIISSHTPLKKYINLVAHIRIPVPLFIYFFMFCICVRFCMWPRCTISRCIRLNWKYRIWFVSTFFKLFSMTVLCSFNYQVWLTGTWQLRRFMLLINILWNRSQTQNFNFRLTIMNHCDICSHHCS